MIQGARTGMIAALALAAGVGGTLLATQSGAVTGSSVSTTGSSKSTTGISISQTGTSVSTTGTSISYTGTSISHTATTIKIEGLKTKTIDISIKQFQSEFAKYGMQVKM